MFRRVALLAALMLAALPVADAYAKGSSGSSGSKNGGSSGSAPSTPPKQTPDDVAAQYLQTVEKSKYTQSDDEAVASVRKLIGYWNDAAVTPATRQPIPNLVTWYAKHKSTAVAVAGIGGLAEIGKGTGTQHLLQVLNALLLRKDAPPDLVTAAFNGLKTVVDPDPSVTAALLQFAGNKDAQIVLKAVDALGAYGAAPAALRNRLVDPMLSSFESMAAVAAKAADKDAVDKWTKVAPQAVSALNALTHQQFNDLAAARKWFNEHDGKPDAWK